MLSQAEQAQVFKLAQKMGAAKIRATRMVQSGVSSTKDATAFLKKAENALKAYLESIGNHLEF
jgi:hypothetical protein